MSVDLYEIVPEHLKRSVEIYEQAYLEICRDLGSFDVFAFGLAHEPQKCVSDDVFQGMLEVAQLQASTPGSHRLRVQVIRPGQIPNSLARFPILSHRCTLSIWRDPYPTTNTNHHQHSFNYQRLQKIETKICEFVSDAKH